MKLIRSLCCTFLLICSLFLILPLSYALDGQITTQWAPPNVDMHDGWHPNGHDGLDIGVDAGTPIDCPADGIVREYIPYVDESGYGIHMYVYLPSYNVTMLIGHCSSLNPDLKLGSEVKKGTILGYVGSTGVSSGPHLHILMHKGDCNPYTTRNLSVNPYRFLVMAGWHLTGDPGDEGGSAAMPFGVEEFYKMGQVLSDIIKQWALIANKAFEYLRDAMVYLALVLCIIDFCLPIAIGMTVSLRDCVVKIMKYTGLIAVIWNWNKFTDKILLSFSTTISGTAAGQGGAEVIAENMSNPQLLMQKGIHLLQPGLDKAASFSGLDFLSQINYILPIYFFTFLVMAAFVLLALFVTLTYLEFYISAALSVVSGPFSAWRMTKFIPEGAVGHLVTSTFKLLVVSFMIAICVGGIKDAKAPDNIFKTTEIQNMQGGGGGVNAPANLVAIADAKAAKYNIPTNLFRGFITTESSWDPNARSKAGACGLGQLMPSTAAMLGCQDVFDPEQNLEASAKYIRQLIDMYNGDVIRAIAAYNAGPGNIDKTGEIPGYAQKYVDTVLSNTNGSFSTTTTKPFTAEELVTFIQYCMGLLGIAILTLIIPKTIVKYFGGKLELP